MKLDQIPLVFRIVLLAGNVARFLLLSPRSQKITRHEFHNFHCLFLGCKTAAVVFPFQFFEVQTDVMFPDSMMTFQSLVYPCPCLLCTVFPALVPAESLEGSATNESCVFGIFLRIFQRRSAAFEEWIDEDVLARQDLQAEYRGGMLLAILQRVIVSLSSCQLLDTRKRKVLLCQEQTKVVVESRNQLVVVSRESRSLFRREVDAEAEKDIRALLEARRVGLFFGIEFFAACGTFSASVLE